MVKVNFKTSDFRRQVADEGALVLKNRYFEQDPFLTDDGASLIARPGLRRLTEVGTGPIRGLASEPGSFNGDLFIASGQELYRMNNLLASSMAFSGLYDPAKGFVRMAITAQIGSVPEYMFLADGRNLFVYTENGYAHNTVTGTPANNDVIRVGSVYYKWTSGSVNAGTPAGTVANPWLVNLSFLPVNAFTNMAHAINASGIAGTEYSTALTANTVAIGIEYTATLLTVRAIVQGTGGNAIITTETGAALAWTLGGTLSGGGAPTVTVVEMPDAVGAIDVAVINSYVIVIPVQSNGFQGRFYWILPGETTVDPLNFATAERSPDGVYGVQVFGDQFWLPGESTTEVWYVAGGADPTVSVMQRLQGVVLDRGSWQNTPKAIHESMMLVDADGGVFLIQGSSPKRVSTPDIEEQIRRAQSRQSVSAL